MRTRNTRRPGAGPAFLAGLLVAGTLPLTAQQIGPQIRVDVNGGVEAANETSIGASEANPDDVVATWNDWRLSTGSELIAMGVGVSNDGGATWNDFLVRPPAGSQSTVEGDPMTAFDQETGTIWVGAISFFAPNGGLFVARKEAGDATFQPSVMARIAFFADKGWMAAGQGPGGPGTTRLYIAYNEGVIWSDDRGQTWTNPRSLGSGIGFLPRVGPNGELYVAYWDFGFGVELLRSFDGGVTLEGPIRIATRLDTWSTADGSRFPGNFRVPPLAALAVDPNSGVLYAAYFDTVGVVGGNSNVDMFFTRSTDQGATWTTPTVINADGTPPGDQFFPWMEVDQNGRIHLVMHDSRNVDQDDNVTNGMLDAYYMYSLDGGDSWSEARLTPSSFDSFDDGLNRFDQFLGDYNGLAVSQNRVWPLYLSNQNGDSDSFINNIVWPDPQLDEPSPGIAGQSNTLTLSGASPGAQVRFGFGTVAGSSSIPGCIGAIAGIGDVRPFGATTADANGDVTLVGNVPASLSGETVLIQALEPSTCSASEVLTFTFQ